MSSCLFIGSFVDLEPESRARSYPKASIVSVQLETKSSEKESGRS